MARRTCAIVIWLALAPVPGSAASETAEDDAVRARDDRIEELERKVEVLTSELERVRTGAAVPEEPGLESVYGLGPAASRVYGGNRGLSLGGYAEGYYRHYTHDQGSGEDETLDDSDFLRLVTYLGYKFDEHLVFNSEIEFEHATTEQDGAVSVEFAYLDYLWRDGLNARGGLLLVPMGFINEIHEPPFFFGVQRPTTERVILPTTWRENGVGLFGRLGESFEYRTYILNGFDAAGFDADGIRDGRQDGSEALAEDLAWVGRLDWTPTPEWLLGGSLYVGDSGQNQEVGGVDLPDARLTMGELHAQYRQGPWAARALFALSHLANAGALNEALTEGLGADFDGPVGERMLGGYVEVAYDVAPLFGDGGHPLWPFLRVEWVNPQDEVPSGFSGQDDRAFWLFTPGINYMLRPNVALKLEYRNFQRQEGDRADEISVGMGLAF